MESGDGLVHLLRGPAAEPQGALILLHGRGTDETDLYPLLDELDPERRLLGITPGGPLTDQLPGGRHWYVIERVGQPDEGTFVATMTELCRFLDEFLRARDLGWEQTILGGFSQGAAVALAAALGAARPAPAGILAMSGFLPVTRGWRLDLAAKRDLPVYISHGSLDKMIPAGHGRRARDVLSEAGLDVIYRESRMLHAIDPELVPEMREWVAARVGEQHPA